MVLVCHAYYTSVYWMDWSGWGSRLLHLSGLGSLGVQLFFVLSGFLITGILLDKVADPNYYKSFYIRRALRILPAYMLTLVALRVFKGVPWNYILACVLFIANMSRLVGASSFEYGVLWSLAVEEQFYLIWPWVVRRYSRKTLFKIMVAILIASPLLRAALAVLHQDTYFKSWDNVDFLLYGAVVALAVRQGFLHSGNIRPVARRLLVFAAVFFVPATFGAMYEETLPWVNVVFNGFGRLPYLALFVGMLLLVVAGHSEQRGLAPARRSAAMRTMFFFGDISYGLYLIHSLVFYVFDKWTAATWFAGFKHDAAILNLRGLICILVSILLATLSRRYYEQPFLNMKGRLTPAPAPIATPLAQPVEELASTEHTA